MKRPTLDKLLPSLVSDLATGTLTSKSVAMLLTQTLGGSDANGAWTWRQAYDLVQAAALLADRGTPLPGDPVTRLNALTAAARQRPTETRRSETQIRLQQFSTPLPYAYVAALAAAIRPGDVALEPSAGTGALAHMVQRMGAKLVLNEIDPFRIALLDAVFHLPVSNFDGEHIDDLLDRAQRVDVVVMNPPFSSSVSRSDPTIALRHTLSAAKRLSPGGRLVAILPMAACEARQPALWTRLTSLVTPRLHLGLPGIVYRKMGTNVETTLLVADAPATGEGVGDSTIALRPLSLQNALDAVRAELPVRPARETSAPLPATPAALRPARRPAPMASVPRAAARAAVDAPLAYVERTVPGQNVAVSEIYARYAPQRIEITGAAAHPSALVESVAMAAVLPPMPNVHLRLPPRLVTGGELSAAQLETIIMAEDSYNHDLPGLFTVSEDLSEIEPAPNGKGVAFRQGYFLGDGTGAGKGRQAAGLMMAGWLENRTRGIWLSKTKTLIEDAIRDWTDLGGAPTDIVPIDRWKPDEPITCQRGILFLTYATLRAVGKTGRTRLEQIIEWAGAEFDGILAFDEAHAMQNAGGSSEGRGTAPSQQGIAGLRLQMGLPRARVLYISATGATNVGNLAYATRLGLWGPGDAYPFVSREDFVAAMEAGGVAAMEVVARDLKALGLYTARALSFEGVEYDILEHKLSEAERTIYDTFASAFRVIHRNLRAALEATGITDAESGRSASAAKASALSRFESMKQRFFGHVLNGFKAKSVIAAIEADLAEGWAPVLQIVSTGESHLDRAIDGLEAGDDLTEVHLTPKEVIVHWLDTAFPIHAQELVEIEGTIVSQPLLDADGRPVVSREAEALRDAALMELYTIAPIPSFLDQIIWHFGETRVAEVTGRSKRTIRTANGALKIAPRSGSANSAESASFMAGTKDILLFSDAGGTGRSYHAAIKAANQKRRRHYLVEPGWRADAAIQGLGRTHRSAQVSAPFFRVVTSDVHGEKRFTSTIARRLDTLGALTRGQRQTGSQNLFRASDNLESPIARRALISHYKELASGTCEAMDYETFTDWTALALTCKDGVLLEDLPPIQRYLNRLLALPIQMQNALFAAFAAKIDAQLEAARLAGTLDVGIETLRADRITVLGEEDIWTCPRSGSVTRTVTLETETALHTPSGAGILSDHADQMRPMRNGVSGKVALVSRRPHQVYDDEVFEEVRYLRRPTGRSTAAEAEYAASHWEPMPQGAFIAAWDAEAGALPKVATEAVVLLTGLLLPIWNTIPSDNERIWRVTPEDGHSRIGRAISPDQALVLKGRFRTGGDAAPDELVASVMETDATVDLGRGLTMRARRVAGTKRLELEGWTPAQVPTLKAAGCFSEIIAHQLRVFVPVGDGATDVIDAIRAGRRMSAA
ncbi:MAG: bifunctional class I SAM-dependent methyltransferase/DEAD/DEAH box helicase [Rhodobacterales bacterium]|nr:bifunctional class I SAM-dependent methyltransferase/DEAD/DEAH box helicase [Rhodobacterales bacterium]